MTKGVEGGEEDQPRRDMFAVLRLFVVTSAGSRLRVGGARKLRGGPSMRLVDACFAFEVFELAGWDDRE